LLILALESSCDETAAAAVRDGREILSSVVASQTDIHAEYGGVVPEIASRKHVECICAVVKESLKRANVTVDDVDAVAVTHAPGLIGALLVGVNFAKSLAFSLKKPLVPVHHLRAHVAANYITHPDLCPPFLALIASGGHSHIVMVNDYTEYEVLGRTRDDAAGEAYDKISRALNLGYPGGPNIERAAQDGDADAVPFKRVTFLDAPYDFSFSGLKTSVITYVQKIERQGNEVNISDVAASFNKTVALTLCEKTVAAAVEKKASKIALAGGVAANALLRSLMEKECERPGLKLYLPPLELCGDNAAMVGAQAFFEYLAGNLGDESLNARAALGIDVGG